MSMTDDLRGPGSPVRAHLEGLSPRLRCSATRSPGARAAADPRELPRLSGCCGLEDCSGMRVAPLMLSLIVRGLIDSLASARVRELRVGHDWPQEDLADRASSTHLRLRY